MTRFYFRVIEGDDGRWLCRRGREEIDAHATRQAATAHMSSLAEQHRPSEVMVHCGDGKIETAASFT